MLYILFPFIHRISITKSRYKQSSTRGSQQISKIETTKFYLCTKGSCSFLIDWPRVNEGEWFCKDYNISLLLLNEPNPSSLVSLFNRVLVFLFSNTIRDHRMSKVQWTDNQTTMDPDGTVFDILIFVTSNFDISIQYYTTKMLYPRSRPYLQ